MFNTTYDYWAEQQNLQTGVRKFFILFLSDSLSHSNYLQHLPLSPPWWGPLRPPAGGGPDCTERGSPAVSRSDDRPAGWSGAAGSGDTAAHVGPAK